jgi:hypothetical protein
MEQDNLSLEEKLLSGCVNCGHMIVEQGYPTPLCKDCRTKFIRYPIPLSIKIFAALIGVALVFAMFNLPGNLSVAIHYKRGKEAIEKANYLTARDELNKVIKKMPGFNDAKEHMIIIAFYNQDFSTFMSLIKELDGKNIEDGSLYQQISGLVEKVPEYLPNDSFMVLFDKYHSFDSLPEYVYHQYISDHPAELFPEVRFASLLFDKKQYRSCDSLLDHILQKDPDHVNALAMKTGIKREFNQFDSAHYYCDRILSLNKESAYGTASKARTYLMQRKDAEGMEWALKNLQLRKNDPYSLATLALAYHFNNKPADRDKILEAAKKDSTQTVYIQYVIDVMNGKEKFR